MLAYHLSFLYLRNIGFSLVIYTTFKKISCGIWPGGLVLSLSCFSYSHLKAVLKLKPGHRKGPIGANRSKEIKIKTLL